MVKAFHDRGIKVYLDVVYNHTGEGDVQRPRPGAVQPPVVARARQPGL